MIKIFTSKISKLVLSLAFFLATFGLTIGIAQPAYAGTLCGEGPYPHVDGRPKPTKTAIDLGCVGKGDPIMDMLFAFIRVLSAGVGVVIIGSIVVAGIQYASSRGEPAVTAKAIARIRSSIGALLIFIFAYAILNYVIPGQFFR